MVSTPTTRLGLRKQGVGDNLNAWGTALNTDVFDLTDEALGVAVAVVPGSGDLTLTNTNYATNQARRSVIALTGTPATAFNVIVPSFDKSWLVHNRTAQIATIKMSSGAGAAIRAGRTGIVYSDGTDCYTQDPTLDQIRPPEAALAMNGKKITGLLAGASPLEGVNYQQWLDLKAYADSITNSGVLAPGTVSGSFQRWNGAGWLENTSAPVSSGAGISIGAPVGGNYVVSVDGGTAANKVPIRDANGHIPAVVSTWVTKTGAYTAVSGDQIRVDSAGGAVSITTPAGAIADDMFVVARDGLNIVTIARNGGTGTIAGRAEDLTLDVNNQLVTLICTAANTWRVVPGKYT